MPIYEYKCDACGELNEFRMKISDSAPESCPDCSKGPLKKQLSMTSFQLKGEGWYVTDFRGDKPNKDSNAESPNDSSNASSSDAVPASTPASTCDSKAPAAKPTATKTSATKSD